MTSQLSRPLWRGRTNVDALTIACIEHAEQFAGHQFVVTQGSYQSTVAASAGTHDGGGAVDLRWCGHAACILHLRRAGFAAWHRTPAQGRWVDHIHAVVIDHPKLSPSAARQVVAYRARKNGLANGARDDGPQLNPIALPVWPWPPAPDLSTPNADTAIQAAGKLGRANPKERKAVDRAVAILKRVRARVKAARR